MSLTVDEVLDRVRQRRREAEQRRAAPPVTCPIDGATLKVRADGRRHCPMGHDLWPDSAVGDGYEGSS